MFLVVACRNASPTTAPTPALTEEVFFGQIEYAHLQADAGNFQLQTSANLTMVWKDAPAGAERYEFVIYPLDGGPSVLLGTDADSSDGVSFNWAVPPNVAADLKGFAYFPDGRVLRAGLSGTIYSAP